MLIGAYSSTMTANTAGTDLKTRLLGLVQPHRASLEAPPFADAQIAAIILLLAEGPLSQEQLLFQITSTFAHFAPEAASASAYFHPKIRDNSRLHRDHIVKRFQEALRLYDLPLRVSQNPDNSEYILQSDTLGAFFLGLPTTLNRYNRYTDAPFRFLDLPPELRNNVYEKLFRFPVSGIRIDGKNKSPLRPLTGSGPPTEPWCEFMYPHLFTVISRLG